jgi:hypothetical protein
MNQDRNVSAFSLDLQSTAFFNAKIAVGSHVLFRMFVWMVLGTSMFAVISNISAIRLSGFIALDGSVDRSGRTVTPAVVPLMTDQVPPDCIR